jgi:hypothetical protein
MTQLPKPPWNYKPNATQASKNATQAPKKRWIADRIWVAGAKGSHSDANRARQARAVGLSNVTRIASRNQPEFEAAKDVARQRLAAWRPGTEEETSMRLEMMIQRLQQSDLTINFNAKDWFRNPCPYTSYKQMFEMCQVVENGRKIDLVTENAWNFPGKRDDEERKKLFGLGGVTPLQRGAGNLLMNAPQRFGLTGGLARVKPGGALLRPKNPHFVGASRPRYAALNFNNCPNGAAPGYGPSALVLKDSVKLRASFCAGDTFGSHITAKTFCTYDTLGALLAWAEDDLFDDLARAVLDNDMKKNSTNFFECHIYEPLEFRSTLERIDFSHRDYQAADWQNVVDFCNRNNVIRRIAP